ncbi:MAG: OPT/YSL family transporter, partial [Planctomycetota bacterium]|nr:OPT/YSL family transporter [Planctomycetota bacterium]
MLGAAFGAVYLGVPAVTGAVFGKAIQIIPLPFIEFTDVTNSILPATATGLTLDLGLFITGMILPFWAVVGGFVGLIVTLIANPLLYKFGVLHTWNASMRTQETVFANHLDFYLSFTAGITFSVAAIGIYAIVRSIRERGGRSGSVEIGKLKERRSDRGDLPIWVPLAIYVFSTVSYIVLCAALVPDFPVWFFIIYGFVYTPLVSYATARLEGIAGQALNIPYVREISFILAGKYAGYQGIGIWFAPIPIHNYGYGAVGFRELELTGTRLSSIIKTELLVFPIVMISSILFSQFIWSLAPIPSDAYPHAQAMWELNAQQSLLLVTSTDSASGEDSPFYRALKPSIVVLGLVLGLATYSVLAFFQLPILLIFGVVRGLGQTLPHGIVIEFAGALIGRYIFLKRFGPMWRHYIFSAGAGYACGVGLIGAASVAIGMISKSVSQMQY